jgi:heat shock protein HslJ
MVAIGNRICPPCVHSGMRALTLILILSGCSLMSSGGASASLEGQWQLQAGSSQGQPVPIVAGSKITIDIEGSRIGGTAACNSYGGNIQIDGSSIVISELFQTEMACVDDRVMASESAYLAALALVSSAARNGAGLVLSGPQVELRFALVPPVATATLTGTVWVLDSLISGDAVSSTVGGRVTLELSPGGAISGSTGCRDFSGQYTITGNQVQVTLDPYDTVGCAEGLADQDAHVLDVISNEFSIAISGTTLTLNVGNKGLSYRAD